MLKIGLTGGIGSGKSTIARIFETLGIPVYYADDAAKRLMNSEADLKLSIINNFGQASYRDGLLDRKYLATIVFNSSEKLSLLNSLVHPHTLRDAATWMLQQQSPYLIKEAALLFEANAHHDLDYVIGVSAPEETRIQRVVKRDKVSIEEVKSRLEKQLPDADKMLRCDFIILNDGKELLIPQAIKIHNYLLNICLGNPSK